MISPAWDRYDRLFGVMLIRYGIVSFQPRECATPQGGIPPVELWPNALFTLTRLQRLRDYVNRPIFICTPGHPRRGYRNEAANNAVGGASGSIHMHFNAFDFEIEDMDMGEMWKVLFERFDEDERNLMGLGQYPTFIHMDTRGLIGQKAPARW